MNRWPTRDGKGRRKAIRTAPPIHSLGTRPSKGWISGRNLEMGGIAIRPTSRIPGHEWTIPDVLQPTSQLPVGNSTLHVAVNSCQRPCESPGTVYGLFRGCQSCAIKASSCRCLFSEPLTRIDSFRNGSLVPKYWLPVSPGAALVVTCSGHALLCELWPIAGYLIGRNA